MLGAVYYFVDPAATHFMPRCMFHELTGLDCPGCGSQRMIHALLHGDFREAWAQNPFLLLMIPFIIFLLWLEFNRKKRMALYIKVHSLPTVIVFCSLLCGWWILRNAI